MRHGAERAHADYRSMLAADDLDAVFVSVDPASHVSIVQDCLAAGLDVFVEKPLGLNAVDARRVADAEAASDGRVMVAFMKRFAPCYLIARELMADTASFGETMSFVSNFAFTTWTDELRDDTFLQLAAIHMVDLTRFLFGEPASVTGFRNSRDADINLAFALRFDSGVVGTLNLAAVPAWRRGHESLTVTGRNGFVTATDLATVTHHVDRPGSTSPWQTLDEDTTVIEAGTSTGSGGERDLYQRGFVGEVAHFLRCVSDGAAPSPSAADNVATMQLVDNLLLAIA